MRNKCNICHPNQMHMVFFSRLLRSHLICVFDASTSQIIYGQFNFKHFFCLAVVCCIRKYRAGTPYPYIKYISILYMYVYSNKKDH